MKTKLLAALFFLLLNNFSALSQQSQPGYKLILADSVKLEVKDISDLYNFPIVQVEKDFIYYTGGDSAQIKVFDFTGKLVGKIPEANSINIRHQHNTLIPTSEPGIFFGIGQRSLIQYQNNKSIPDTIKFNGFFKNKYYYLNVSQGVTNYAYSPEHKTFYAPVFHFAKDLAHVKNPKYYRQSDKLLAVCKIEGKELKIKNLVADRDSMYYQALFPDLNHLEFYLAENGAILYVNEMASPKIRVYSHDGQKLKVFGERAKYPGINEAAIPNPYKLNREKGGYLGFKYFIESPVYTFIYHASESKLTFRGYRSSVKDPTTYKKYKVEVIACNYVPETPTDKAQHAALKTKPYGLQIYDAHNKLVFDELMPRPSRNILKVDGNTIWIDGRADKANNTYWIYKYKINSLEIIGSSK